MNTPTDAVDISLGDHICDADAAEGNQCTLRAALMESYEHSGDDTVNLPYATYPITIPSEGPTGCGASGFDLTKGDFDLGKKITINDSVQPNDVTINGITGPEGALPTIDANGVDRVFQIAGSSGYFSELFINDVLIREGNHPSEGSCYSDQGGAVWVDNFARLEATNVTFTENGELANDNGGALAVGPGAAAAIVTDSWFTNNKSSNGGGAIYTYNGGLVKLTRTTLENNQSNGGGGAIANYGDFDIGITDSKIENNTCNFCYGGGINVSSSGSGAMVVKNSVINNNISTRGGGGIYWNSQTNRSLTITDTTVSGNKAEYGGGGLWLTGGAGSVSMNSSTISENLGGAGSTPNASGDGGGIWTEAPLTLTNSTVSGNTTTRSGGGIYQGPQVAQFGGNAFTIKNSTIANNGSDSDLNGSGNGGNIHAAALDTADRPAPTLTNSIVANPTRGENCFGAVTLLGKNLFESPAGCQLNGNNASRHLIASDPQLGPLTDNGGSTKTHLPGPGSPAIDAADNSMCPEKDQRGEARPQDGDYNGSKVCDLGALESEGVSVVNGKIAYGSIHYDTFIDDSRILTIQPDGSSVQILTENAFEEQHFDIEPSWSPDGSRLAFAQSYAGPNGDMGGIYTIANDGSDLRQLTHTTFGDMTSMAERDPDWSPDGTQIIFAREIVGDGQPTHIYVVGTDGSGLTKLTTGVPPGFASEDPAWSPDGETIAFVGNIGAEGASDDLYLMDSDGTNIRALTNTPDNEFAPSWSPDGSHLIYGGGAAGGIQRIHATGGNASQIIDMGTYSAYSPDGEKIAFRGPSQENNHPAATALWIMNADGTNPTLVRDRRVDGLDWQPLMQSSDSDGIPNHFDNCPAVINFSQTDTDGDGKGNACDDDDDGDGVNDGQDKLPLDPTETQDSDSDGIGNNADLDDDNDGVNDTTDGCDFSAEDDDDVQDGDGCPETDADNDGRLDGQDAFPEDAGETDDADNDGTGDNSDLDDDNDGVNDAADACDLIEEDGDNVQDGDGCPETDADNDGRPDAQDAFPENATETDDADMDGTGDNSDTDDDNDTVSDTKDKCEGVKEDLDGKQDGDGCIDKVAATGVSIGYKARPDVFKGTVSSSKAACTEDRKVTLFKVKKRDDAQIGNPVTTDDEGLYSAPAKGLSGKAYAEVAQRSLQPDGMGIVWTCSAGQSDTIPFG